MDTRRNWFKRIAGVLTIGMYAKHSLAGFVEEQLAARDLPPLRPPLTGEIVRPTAMHEVEFYESSKPGMSCNTLFLRLTLDDRIDKGHWVNRERFVTVAFHLEPNGFHQCWKPVHEAIPGMAIACRTAEVVIDRVHVMARDTFGSYYPTDI